MSLYGKVKDVCYEVEVKGVPVMVDAIVSGGSRGVRGSYGEPLEPDEAPSIEIVKVETLDGTYEITYLLNGMALLYIENEIWERVKEGGDE